MSPFIALRTRIILQATQPIQGFIATNTWLIVVVFCRSTGWNAMIVSTAGLSELAIAEKHLLPGRYWQLAGAPHSLQRFWLTLYFSGLSIEITIGPHQNHANSARQFHFEWLKLPFSSSFRVNDQKNTDAHIHLRIDIYCSDKQGHFTLHLVHSHLEWWLQL